MANITIAQLPAAAAAADTDEIEVSQAGVSKKVTRAQLLAGRLASGPIGSSGLTMTAARVLARLTAGNGAVEELASLPISLGGTGATDAATARTNLGLGGLATQDSNNVAITGGSISGIADLAIADGGTGAGTAAAARTNLGAAASGANSDITSLAGLTTALSVAQGGTGAATAAAARTSLGLAIGTNVQAYNAQLAALAALAINGLIARTAANTVTARSLAAGSTKISITNADGVAGNPTIDVAEANLSLANIGGTLPVAKGGTGAADAAAARANLGLGSANNVAFNTVVDASGNLRALPINPQTAAYSLVAADVGKVIRITGGGITVPSGVFQPRDAITIYNNSATNQTITQGSGVTIYLAGTATTGNRTLAQRGLCTILCVNTNEFVISGAGLT
jgi:hypothetical protein